MKGISKLVALGAVMAASSSVAFADGISGSFSITGIGQFTPNSTNTGGTITIDSASVGAQSSGGQATVTGTFADYLTSGNSVSFLTPLSFSDGAQTIASGTPALITVTENGETFSIYGLTYEGFTAGTGTQEIGGIADGVGYITGTGAVTYDQSPATFSFTIQAGGVTTFSAQADATGSTTAVTPEPNSLVLLGTGLVGAAGILFARRRDAESFS